MTHIVLTPEQVAGVIAENTPVEPEIERTTGYTGAFKKIDVGNGRTVKVWDAEKSGYRSQLDHMFANPGQYPAGRARRELEAAGYTIPDDWDDAGGTWDHLLNKG